MSASSGSNKRLINEVTKLKALSNNPDASSMKFLLDRSPIDESSRTGSSSDVKAENIILGRILPTSHVYCHHAFQTEMKLPADLPFKPPEVRFITPIYHPNVDEKGKICVDLLNSSESWKPTTPLVDVVKAVVDLIDTPIVDEAVSQGKTIDHVEELIRSSFGFFFSELAAEYQNRRAVFDENVRARIRANQVPRP